MLIVLSGGKTRTVTESQPVEEKQDVPPVQVVVVV